MHEMVPIGLGANVGEEAWGEETRFWKCPFKVLRLIPVSFCY